MKWSLASKPAAAFSTPAAPEGGKSDSGGGGVASAGGGGVTIVKLSSPEILATNMCLGLIGAHGKKMCIAPNCEVRSHNERKADLSQLGDIPVVFIQAKQQDAVYLEPRVPASRLGSQEAITRYMEEIRSIDEWDTFLRGLVVKPEFANFDEETEARILFERVKKTRQEEKFGKTPMKKRPKLDVTSPALAADFDLTLVPVSEDLGDEESMMLNTLRAEWKNVTLNMSTLKDLVAGCKEVSMRLTEATRDEFADVDFHLATLKNLIGTRPEDMDPVSVFEAIQELGSSVASKASRLTDDEQRLLGQTNAFLNNYSHRETALKEEISRTTLQSFDPLIRLFSQLSSDKNTPGNLLEKELHDIRQELQNVRSQAAAAVATATTMGQGLGTSAQVPAGHMNWGLPNNPTRFSTATPQPTHTASGPGSTFATVPMPGGPTVPSATSAQITALEHRLRNIEDQLISQRVELGGTTFKSLSFTKTWLTTNAPSKFGYIFFADAHSLLTVASTRSAIDTAEVIDYRASAVKSGFDDALEATIVTSFEIELPSFFGRDAVGKRAVSDSRVLPAVQSFKEWDSGDAYTGARYRFSRQVEAAANALRRGADNQLQGTGHLLATEAINRSLNFLTQLSNWMSKQHTDLTNRGSSSDHAWQLISHCVRAIFADLNKAREGGYGPFLAGDQPAGVMWGCLQGLRRMKEYASVDFSAHPKLSHILNLHLQDNAMMKSTFASFKQDTVKRIMELEKTQDKLVKALDQLTTKVNSKCK